MLDDVDRLERWTAGPVSSRPGWRRSRIAWTPRLPRRWSDTAEQTNEALVRLKDGLWRIRRDRIAGAGRSRRRGRTEEATLEAFAAIQTALSALDRLEVRGRGSAGLHVLVSLDMAWSSTTPSSPDAGPTRQRPAVRSRIGARRGCLNVYKAASEVGELGDNVRMLRAAISGDVLLHRALAADGATCVVLGHTRWASVGMINEANAHPLNQEEDSGAVLPYVVAALNGDVDNHLELVQRHGLRIPGEITTDAKVIPVLVARRLARDNTPRGVPPHRGRVRRLGGGCGGRDRSSRRAPAGLARQRAGAVHRPRRGRLHRRQRALWPCRGVQPVPANGRRGGRRSG